MPLDLDAAIAPHRIDGFRFSIVVILFAIAAMHGMPYVGAAMMGSHDTTMVTASTAPTHSPEAVHLTASHTGDAMDHFLHLCLAVLGSLLLAIGAASVLRRARHSTQHTSAAARYLSGRSPPHWWTITIHRLCISRT